MSILENLFAGVAGLSWHGSLLIAVYVALRLLLRQYLAPRLLFGGWLVVATLLLVPWRVPVSWHPLARWEVPAMAPVLNAEPAERVLALPRTLGNVASLAPARLLERPEAAKPPPAMARFTVWGQKVLMSRDVIRALAVLWLVVAVALVLLRALALGRLHRALVRTSQRVDARLAESVRQEATTLGLRRAPAIMVTPLVDTPALGGVLRPRLLFPVGFETRVSAAELRWVVRHELGHLRRRDTAAQAWMQLACAVHWFNPLVWVAARLARQDCELACDEAVLCRHAGEAGDRLAYGQTLLKVLGGARSALRLPAAVGIVESRRQLMKRIALIADYRPLSLSRTLAGVTLLAGAVWVGATEAAAPGAMPVPSAPVQLAPTVPPGGAMPSRPALSPEMQAQRAAAEAKQKEWEDGLTFVLVGIGRPAGVPVALIDVAGSLCAVTSESQIERHRVQAIDVEGGRVTLQRQGQPPQMLTLITTNPIRIPEMGERQVASMLSKDSIKRMNAYQGMPAELTMVWNKLSRDGQAEVLLSYLNRGQVVGLVRSPYGATGFSSRLLAKQISQLLAEKRKAFMDSLTDEQKSVFLTRQQAIRFTDPPAEREKQAAAGKVAQAKQEEMLANLTPEQRVLYDEYQSWLKP